MFAETPIIMSQRKIDHLVYCVPNLGQGIIDIENKLGVKAIIGGAHLTQGTKNALINLGEDCYLEILAIDKSNIDIKPPRWMGIDLIQSAKITRWALKTQDIIKDSKNLKKHNPDMGHVTGGSRKMTNGKTLTWEIAMPLAAPEVDIVPFITDWSKSEAHPTDTLNQKCNLLELRLNHPNPKELQNLFDQMQITLKINKSDTPSIQTLIQCPNCIAQL